jgi:hypothetical protein
MTNAEGNPVPSDYVVITIDIDDCPMAEIPLAEVFDPNTSLLLDDYHNVIRGYVVQQLEDTTWLTDVTTPILLDAGFGMYYSRDRGVVLSLRKPALQRLISERISRRDRPEDSVFVPLLIRFLLPDVDIPKPPRTSVSSSSSASRASPGPSEEGTNPTLGTPVAVVPPIVTTMPPIMEDARTPPPETGATIGGSTTGGNNATFRGIPIDTQSVTDTRPGHYQTPRDPFGNATQRPHPTRPMFDSATTARTNALVRTPTRNHPYSAEVTFGAETFEEYMSQFMYAEVKFKDFRKAIIPKFDSSKQDSFVHWYKLFCSTCLQWGVWCPPYESAQEDNIYGAWWVLLPASVRTVDRFMSGLIYSALILERTFPEGSKEISAVEGCPPNAGYHALYALLRLHHPLLHSVFSTANVIPRQRRSESFSLYTRRLQDFMARERLATRTYTESEALDLAVRNLLPDWGSEIRRMVERDKRSGPVGAMPFKLTMPQLATTFVEYAAEIGRDAPATGHATGSRHQPTIRRIESSPAQLLATPSTDDALGDDEIDLVVRAISQNQASSAVCLGCQQPGHTLEQCNRFVDYIVAESLAQRHPQLKAQVALSHRQFRTRLSSATARDAASTARTVRSLQVDGATVATATSSITSPTGIVAPPDYDDPDEAGYQQHAILVQSGDPDEDFEACFLTTSVNSVTIPAATDLSLPTAESVSMFELPAVTDEFLLRRLAATRDEHSSSLFAHADNGSMACTTNALDLLFSYRPLSARASVRLYDAGHHAHRPVGVGFLRIPVDRRGVEGGATSIFVRTYYTPSIPGIIVSHSAISKQLGTAGYHMSSFCDAAGYIHFPHRLRRCQDVFMLLQPTDKRGGLTFTEALLVPTEAERSGALPTASMVNRLCSDHTLCPASARLDPTDGMTCDMCHNPPGSDFC